MKNVTKILTAVTLCAALFASQQRIDALGGNAALWPGDEANIAAFPAQVNNHSFLQLSGVGNGSDNTTGAASMVFQKDGTTWGFNYGGADDDGVPNDEWVNMHWGNGSMGVAVSMEKNTDAAGNDTGSDMTVSYGNGFDWGEIGVHYATMDNGDGDAKLGVNYRTAWGFFLFDNTVVNVVDLMEDDLEINTDFFSHMDAGGADVVYGWGFDYDAAEGITQRATIGVEANMTDWATLRAGYKWEYALSTEGSDATGDPSGMFAWGLGFNWGGLTADLTVDSSLLQDPIGTITGESLTDGSSNGLTNSALTLTYSF